VGNLRKYRCIPKLRLFIIWRNRGRPEGRASGWDNFRVDRRSLPAS
jgi:hypothetical protein